MGTGFRVAKGAELTIGLGLEWAKIFLLWFDFERKFILLLVVVVSLHNN